MKNITMSGGIREYYQGPMSWDLRGEVKSIWKLGVLILTLQFVLKEQPVLPWTQSPTLHLYKDFF